MSRKRTIGSILDSVSITHKFDKKKLIFLNTSDVLEGKILIDNYMEVASLKGQAKKSIKNDDILYSEIRPKNKRYAYVNVPNPEDYVVSTKLMVLRNKTVDVLTPYVYYFLTSEGTLDYLQMRAENRIGSFPQITFDIVKPLELNVPDPVVQKKIIDVINSIDSKIELNNNINTELETMVKMLFDYWFIQFDFPNDKGKPYRTSGGKMVWNVELNREVPSNWSSGTLIDLGEIIGGSTPPREVSEYFSQSGTAWITPKDLSMNGSNKFISKGELDVSEQGIKKSSLNIMPKGTIMLSTRAPIGYLAISRGLVTTNQGFKSFVPNKGYSSEYVYYAVKNMIPTIENNAVGSTFKEISLTTLKSLPVILPEKDLVKKFTNSVASIFEKQNLLEVENQKLTELRDWLLPLLMNGQVKVK